MSLLVHFFRQAGLERLEKLENNVEEEAILHSSLHSVLCAAIIE